jgi:hypothetical protein
MTPMRMQPRPCMQTPSPCNTPPHTHTPPGQDPGPRLLPRRVPPRLPRRRRRQLACPLGRRQRRADLRRPHQLGLCPACRLFQQRPRQDRDGRQLQPAGVDVRQVRPGAGVRGSGCAWVGVVGGGRGARWLCVLRAAQTHLATNVIPPTSVNNKLVAQEAQLGQLQRQCRTLTVDADDRFVYCGTTTGDVLQVGGGGVLCRAVL